MKSNISHKKTFASAACVGMLFFFVVFLYTCFSQAVEPPKWLKTGEFSWKSTPALVSPANRPDDPCVSSKDPTLVFFDGKYHLFTTIRSEKRTHQIEYMSFTDWENANEATRHILPIHGTFYCAPQVFYFSPQKKWYLICQASHETWQEKYGAPYGACFSTTENIADPNSWTPLVPLAASPAGTNWGLDFWIICDDRDSHLFFTTLDGNMWRESTPLTAFPHGWSEPVLAIKDDIFEASHTYKLRGRNQYITIVEAQNGPGWRYYKAYLADRLAGPWTPLATSHEKNFAGANNVTFPDGRWSDSISHVELFRSGFDERLEIDPNHLRLIYQGVSDRDRAGKIYGQIPWKLGLLESDE